MNERRAFRYQLLAATNARVPMLPGKETKTNVGVGIGVLLQLAGFFWARTGDPASIIGGVVLILVSIPVFTWGCMNYAEGKGYSKWVGLIGLAGIIGLIVLVVLPDQDPHGSVARLQLRKFVASICMVAAVGLVVLGRWLYDLGNDVRLERLLHPWPAVCMILGFCLVFVSLTFMVVGNRRR